MKISRQPEFLANKWGGCAQFGIIAIPMEYKQILQSVKKGTFHPVYFLHGDDPYFIDKIALAIIQYSKIRTRNVEFR